MPQPEPLGILLLSGSYERAHYAFMIAAGAGAVGRQVVVFATNGGCRAVAQDWSALEHTGGAARDQDRQVQSHGVAGFDALREAAGDLGVRLLVCDSGLQLSGVAPESLLAGVEIAGIPAFLSAVGPGQIVTL